MIAEKIPDLDEDYKDDYLSDVSDTATDEEKVADLDGDYKDNYLSDISNIATDVKKNYCLLPECSPRSLGSSTIQH